MAGSDPLGRRALFWLAPTEDQPSDSDVKSTKRSAKHSNQAIDEGRRAFYSKAGSRMDGGMGNSTRGGRSRSRRSSGHYAGGRGGSERNGVDKPLTRADTDVVVDSMTGRPSDATPGAARSRVSDNGIKPGDGSKIKHAGGVRGSSRAEDCPYGILCVDITCGSCKKTATVTMQEFLAMHWPVWLWLPGRGNTHLLTCPMCRKRTWLSVSWPSSSRR